MAKELPRLRVPLRVRSFASRPGRETASPRGGHRPECSCRRRSTAATLIGQIAQLVPRSAPESACNPLPLKLARRSLNGAPGLVSVTTRRSPRSTSARSVTPSRSATLRASRRRGSEISIVVFMRMGPIYMGAQSRYVAAREHSVLVVDRSSSPLARPSTEIPPRRHRALRLGGFERQARRRRAGRRAAGSGRSGCPGAFAPSSVAAGGPRRRAPRSPIVAPASERSPSIGVRSSMRSATIWMTPCSLCSLPVTATKRAPSTIARKRSNAFGQTMTLAMPASSSSVMKMTPLAVPGRWRTSTRPATVDPLAVPDRGKRVGAQDSARGEAGAHERGRMGLQGQRQAPVVLDHMRAERHRRQSRVRLGFARRSRVANSGRSSWSPTRSRPRTAHKAWRRSRPSERKASASASRSSTAELKPLRSQRSRTES